MSRHRTWCFTINNWTESDRFGVQQLFKKCDYGIVGEEKGTLLQTPHLQGYVRLTNALSLIYLKKYLPRANLRVANGTDLENQAYCSKEGHNVIEIGEPSQGQGKRNDISDLAVLIKSGETTIEDVMFEFPLLYMKYSRSIEKMFNAIMKPRKDKPTVIWLHGLAGVGKTKYVMDNHKSVYIKDNTPWWDGYTQQEAICIDDYDNKIPFRTFLRIIDRYVYQAQVKGSYVQVNSPYIYITCEFSPDYYWSENALEQVTRRLTSVIELK